jgi:membrane dipeptidase
LAINPVADPFDHVVAMAGHDHVGLGGDLDGIPFGVDGLSGVDGYPLLFAELIRRGWNDRDLAKLAGGNVLRALRGAEATARAMASSAPALDKLP